MRDIHTRVVRRAPLVWQWQIVEDARDNRDGRREPILVASGYTPNRTVAIKRASRTLAEIYGSLS